MMITLKAWQANQLFLAGLKDYETEHVWIGVDGELMVELRIGKKPRGKAKP